MERISGCLYDHFETILGFMRNEQMGFSETFRGNKNGVNHPQNNTSHIGTPRNVSGENMTRPGEIKKMSQNQSKLKVIIHTFGFSRDSSSERHGMPARGMGGHWKEVMWLRMNMWMLLCSFHDNFRFHEK